MSDNNPTPDTPEPAKPEPATIVIGSNLEHARRACTRRGLDRSHAHAVDTAVDHLTKGANVILARPPGDLAADWDRIETKAGKLNCTIETDPSPS